MVLLPQKNCSGIQSTKKIKQNSLRPCHRRKSEKEKTERRAKPGFWFENETCTGRDEESKCWSFKTTCRKNRSMFVKCKSCECYRYKKLWIWPDYFSGKIDQYEQSSGKKNDPEQPRDHYRIKSRIHCKGNQNRPEEISKTFDLLSLVKNETSPLYQVFCITERNERIVTNPSEWNCFCKTIDENNRDNKNSLFQLNTGSDKIIDDTN